MRSITRLVFLPADSLGRSLLDALLELAVEHRHPNVLLTKRESIYSIKYPLLPRRFSTSPALRFSEFRWIRTEALIG